MDPSRGEITKTGFSFPSHLEWVLCPLRCRRWPFLLLLMRRTCILYFATFHPKQPFWCGHSVNHIFVLINGEKGKWGSDSSSSIFSLGLYHFLRREEMVTLSAGGRVPLRRRWPPFRSLLWPCVPKNEEACVWQMLGWHVWRASPCLFPAWLFPRSAPDPHLRAAGPQMGSASSAGSCPWG